MKGPGAGECPGLQLGVLRSQGWWAAGSPGVPEVGRGCEELGAARLTAAMLSWGGQELLASHSRYLEQGEGALNSL